MYTEEADRLRSFVHNHVGDPVAADNITGDSWSKVLAKWSTFDNPKTMLYRIARDAIKDWYKSRRPDYVPLEEITDLTYSGLEHARTDARDPSVIVPARLDLAKAISSLPKRMQVAFILYVVDDLDVETVASMMGIGPETVRTHVAKARQRLETHQALTGYTPVR